MRMSLDLGGEPQRLAQGASASPAWLEIAKTIVEIGGTIITAIAVIIGGGWVYYKFFKERTYYPRIDISITGQGRFDRQLHVRVTLKNTGTSRIDLQREGTALVLSHQDTIQSRTLEVRWIERGAFSIFSHHSWIEPGERISYDLLLKRLNSRIARHAHGENSLQ